MKMPADSHFKSSTKEVTYRKKEDEKEKNWLYKTVTCSVLLKIIKNF